MRVALDHWDGVCEMHGIVCEFVEWLGEIGIELEPSAFPGTLDALKPDRLADAFLGVNRSALEAERRALAKAARG